MIADAVEGASEGGDLWEQVRPQCEDYLCKVRCGSGTLAYAVEWELAKLQARIRPEPALPRVFPVRPDSMALD
ncbi:MAG: hypothetical protein D4R81_08465 [Nitrospiraceae bacterium]|nr:MAG: hypothetical protein D4R81_08465 [Nitrospiraceae bacterium]